MRLEANRIKETGRSVVRRTKNVLRRAPEKVPSDPTPPEVSEDTKISEGEQNVIFKAKKILRRPPKRAPVGAIFPMETNAGNDLFADFINSDQAARIRPHIFGVYHALKNSSERFSASYTTTDKPSDNSGPRLHMTDTPIRIYFARDLAIQDKMPEIDESGKSNNVSLIVAIDAEKKDGRLQVADIVRDALMTHAQNRAAVFQGNDSQGQDLSDNEVIAVFDLPLTAQEEKAMKPTPKNPIPRGVESGNLYDAYRIQGRTGGRFHSVFIFKMPEPDMPELHVYLGLMPAGEMLSEPSDFGTGIIHLSTIETAGASGIGRYIGRPLDPTAEDY